MERQITLTEHFHQQFVNSGLVHRRRSCNLNPSQFSEAQDGQSERSWLVQRTTIYSTNSVLARFERVAVLRSIHAHQSWDMTTDIPPRKRPPSDCRSGMTSIHLGAAESSFNKISLNLRRCIWLPRSADQQRSRWRISDSHRKANQSPGSNIVCQLMLVAVSTHNSTLQNGELSNILRAFCQLWCTTIDRRT